MELSRYAMLAATPSFRRKVIMACDMLESVPDVLISSSWGKDSVVLVDLALHAGHRDTLYLAFPHPLPGTQEVMDAFAQRGAIIHVDAGLDLDSYIEYLRSVGLPHERTRSQQGRAVSQLKKDRGVEWAKEHGFSTVALGMRAAESQTRAKLFRFRGTCYEAKGLRWLNPLAYWSHVDIWTYIASRELPYNHRIYDAETHGETRETIRNTGWLSTDGALDRGRIGWLRYHFPDQYRALCEHFPEMRTLS